MDLNEYLPLKQGLRPSPTAAALTGSLNEYLPLKQGLRHLQLHENDEVSTQ